MKLFLAYVYWFFYLRWLTPEQWEKKYAQYCEEQYGRRF